MADAVHRRLVRVVLRSGVPVASAMGPLPLPLSDLAVGADGMVHVVDRRARSLTTLAPAGASRIDLPNVGEGLRFVRHGDELLLRVGDAYRSVWRRTLSAATRR